MLWRGVGLTTKQITISDLFALGFEMRSQNEGQVSTITSARRHHAASMLGGNRSPHSQRENMKVWKWRHRISISVLTSTGWDLPVLADDRAKPKICVGVRGRTLFCAVACTASEIQSSDVLLNGLLQKDFMRHSSIQTTLNTYG